MLRFQVQTSASGLFPLRQVRVWGIWTLTLFSGPESRAALVGQMSKRQTLGEGIRTTEMLQTAAIDLGLHLAQSVPDDFKKFEDDVAETVRVPKEVPAVIL